MRIVCWQTILLNITPYFCRKLGKILQNLLSAAVMIGALRVKNLFFYIEMPMISDKRLLLSDVSAALRK